MAREEPGLRERKKQATREAVATAARNLFDRRGFDSVTVAEVAAAADVSEKTVFNHFPAKEDLAFAGGEQPVARLLGAIADREPGTPVIDVFRTTTEAMIASVWANADEHEELLAVTRIVRGSPDLQDRMLAKWEREYEALAAAIATTSGAREGDVLPEIAARTLWWTHRAIFRATIEGVITNEDPKKATRRLRRQAARAYEQVAAGLGDYGA